MTPTMALPLSAASAAGHTRAASGCGVVAARSAVLSGRTPHSNTKPLSRRKPAISPNAAHSLGFSKGLPHRESRGLPHQAATAVERHGLVLIILGRRPSP